jgi:hypothetical protein
VQQEHRAQVSTDLVNWEKRPPIVSIPEKLLIAVLGPIWKPTVSSRRLGVKAYHDVI